MIEIRKIQPTDLERVTEITKNAFPDSWPESYFKKLIEEYPNDFFVAKKDEKIVGYVLGYEKANGQGWIKAIAVSPESQGQGIGTEMMAFITKRLEKAETIGLHARTSNRKGVSFYQNLGFDIVKTIEGYYANGDSAYLMEKRGG
ncbi:MAG: ribosomal protein S18-alanine N-acetyltransferase [Candidatus Paceibacterota bacterium]|jgi:ribosomal-protein-alanine acetyltransferase|nr:ribosomal protein S18-alanine N-acetyltransferase [Candidatus Paceibacterota bacterium]